MVFSSVIFLFLFLPLVLILHSLTPERWRNGLLLTASLCFYAWGEGVYLGVMLVSIVMNYGFTMRMERGNPAHRTGWMITAVTANLLLLAFFKYGNFLVDNINLLGGETPLLTPQQIHLPIGISFFTFQAISYVVEVYRRVSPLQTSVLNVGLYIALFPQLIAGPIVRYRSVAAEITSRTITLGDRAQGIQRFILGLGKKIVLANPLGEIADQIFALPAGELSTSVAWLGVICYSLQIYFDFSGYSDMAIGLGRLFGFRFPENFNYPYISQSIQEFWRRWHISLSEWFRDFLYIPLGGNRKGPVRTYCNLLIVFVLCGLWHGASWNFVIWGLLHGLFLIAERLGLERVLSRLWRPIRHLYVLFFVMVAWVFFRSETLAESVDYLGSMFSAAPADSAGFMDYLNNEQILLLCVAIVLCAPVLGWFGARTRALPATAFGMAKSASLLVLLGYASIQLMVGSHNPFIYFRF